MHISKEFLLEAVSLSLLVILILISMQMFQKAMKVIAVLEKRQDHQMIELEEYEITKYDGLIVDGMTAISYIKRLTGTYDLPVEVITETGEFEIKDHAECNKLRDVKSEKYMNPMAKYKCEIQRDENQVITEIKISVEKEGD